MPPTGRVEASHSSKETPKAGHYAWPVAELRFDVASRLLEIDQLALRKYRLNRFRAELKRREIGAALLFDPMNIRYVSGTRNMALFTLHAPSRYLFVCADGPVILFEGRESLQVAAKNEVLDDVRPSTPWFYFAAGPRMEEKTRLWAQEIVSLVTEYCRGNQVLAVDRCEPWGADLLRHHHIQLVDAQGPIEHARSIKSAEEIKCIQVSVDTADVGITAMRAAAKPGLTENQLWSVLHSVNISHGGEWIECRLLSSGQRTNPWFQETGDRLIEAGDMIAVDTNLIGPAGYLADISRSFVCPGVKPTDAQRSLYGLAQEQVLHNVALVRPGLTFREFAERSWKVPQRFLPNRYGMLAHGVGFEDEFPSVPFIEDWDESGYDGQFEANMVVSVESYIGEVGGREGVKLEQMVLITDTGPQALSRSPLIDALEA